MDGHDSGTWRDYRPSKTTLFWACVGCVVATLVIGFVWVGWVTGGTAAQMAEDAAAKARADLAGTICADRFLNSTEAKAQLADLKKTNYWERDEFLEKNGWLEIAGLEDPVDGAADLCLERLMNAELPEPAQEPQSG